MALRPGGRFVAEMGGAGNCATLHRRDVHGVARVRPARAGAARGTSPSPAEYAPRLEKAGFTVRLLEYFDRPTPLDECPDGAADWVRMFAGYLLAEVPPMLVEPLLRRVNELAAPALRRESRLGRRLRPAPVRRGPRLSGPHGLVRPGTDCAHDGVSPVSAGVSGWPRRAAWPGAARTSAASAFRPARVARPMERRTERGDGEAPGEVSGEPCREHVEHSPAVTPGLPDYGLVCGLSPVGRE